MRKQLQPRGYALTERLCVYPQYMDPHWMEQGVLDVVKLRFWSFIPRRGSGRREERPIRRDLVPGAIARAREGAALSPDELTALFAETRPEAIEDMRQAADELRVELAGDTVTFVVNRNINVSNICVVGCAFCGFGQGKRSPDAYEHSRGGFPRAACARRSSSGPPRSACSRGSIPTGRSPTTSAGCGWRRTRRRRSTCTPTRRWRSTPWPPTCRWPRSSGGCARPASGSTPGTAAEVLHDGVRERISPNKLPVGRWVEVIEACHAAGVRSTVTVMFGHIEEPWELAEHMRVVRELQERTGGFTEFVPLSFIPFHTLLGRTHGIEEISQRGEPQAHGGVPARPRQDDPEPPGELGQDGPGAATEALRWGVNDLGGTLMEESISRMAGSEHGVRLDPEDLIGAAWAAGRPAAERDTLYDILRRYELPVAA